MFCPKCNQQQVSDDVRFCSRCGFPLNVVAELLANDGALPVNQAENTRALSFLHRKGVRLGAKIIFWSIALTLPGFAVSIVFDSPVPLLISLIPFLIGVLQILYTFIFGESIFPLRRDKQTAELPAREAQLKLDTSPIKPLPLVSPKPLNTNEIIQPPSVTEPTTKLLKKD